MRLWVDGEAGIFLADGAEEGVDLGEGIDLVAEEFDAVGVLVVGGVDLDDVSADSEGAAAEVDVVAVIEDFDEALGDVFALDLLALFEEEEHAVVSFGRAEAVDAGDGGDDDAVSSFEEAARGGETELVQLFVDGGFLLDEEVAGWDVGFGLVIVVVGDEVFDGVLGEEGFELVVELGGESLVVREDEGGALDLLDDLGHGEGFARAGDAEQDLILLAGSQAGDEFRDGSGLIALRCVGGGELKVHSPPEYHLGEEEAKSTCPAGRAHCAWRGHFVTCVGLPMVAGSIVRTRLFSCVWLDYGEGGGDCRGGALAGAAWGDRVECGRSAYEPD